MFFRKSWALPRSLMTHEFSHTGHQDPLISVCIPAFNGRDFIGAAIASVLAQTFTDFELIVVDDCSTDGTIDIVHSFHDPRIRVQQNSSNQGFVNNWNAAVRASRAPLVKLLCDDDLLYPECLQRQVAVFQGPDAGAIALVCARRDIIDPDGHIVIKNRGWKRGQGRIAGNKALRTIVRSGVNPIGEPLACLFRRADFERCGGFSYPHCYVQDLAFYTALLQIGDLFVLPDSLGAFRLHRNSATMKMARSQGQEMAMMYRSLYHMPHSPLQPLDIASGSVKARLYAILRRMFCAWVLRPRH